MIEKRFTRIVCSNDEYTGSLYCNDEPLKIDEVCKLLNELHEENEALKHFVEINFSDMMAEKMKKELEE